MGLDSVLRLSPYFKHELESSSHILLYKNLSGVENRLPIRRRAAASKKTMPASR